MYTEHALERADAAVTMLRELRPPVDVVMLQEVTATPRAGDDPTSSMLARFRDGMGADYALHADEAAVAGGQSYFVVLLVRKGLFGGGDVAVRCAPFAGSRMGRGIVSVTGSVGDGKGKGKGKGSRRQPPSRVCFVTSHLESERAGAEQRRAQMAQMVALMRANAADGVATVFGGDTNLREPEVSGAVFAKNAVAEAKERDATAASRPPEKRKVGDAFVQAGAPDEHRYTWDMARNDNLDMSASEFAPRTRYDRVFVFGPADWFPSATSWTLLGKTRLDCGVFISDHWGVLVDVAIPAAQDEAEDGTMGEEKVGSDVVDAGGVAPAPASADGEVTARVGSRASSRKAKRQKSSER